MAIYINIHDMEGFSKDEEFKFRHACNLLSEVLNSVEFKKAMEQAHLTGTNGFTNTEIYNLILSGRECGSADDMNMDLYVTIYGSFFSRVVGYTKKGTVMTWINRKFFKKFNYAEVAGNIVHEWLHKAGFDHISEKDYTSVPYAVGNIVRKLVEDHMKEVKHDG